MAYWNTAGESSPGESSPGESGAERGVPQSPPPPPPTHRQRAAATADSSADYRRGFTVHNSADNRFYPTPLAQADDAPSRRAGAHEPEALAEFQGESSRSSSGSPRHGCDAAAANMDRRPGPLGHWCVVDSLWPQTAAASENLQFLADNGCQIVEDDIFGVDFASVLPGDARNAVFVLSNLNWRSSDKLAALEYGWNPEWGMVKLRRWVLGMVWLMPLVRELLLE